MAEELSGNASPAVGTPTPQGQSEPTVVTSNATPAESTAPAETTPQAESAIKGKAKAKPKGDINLFESDQFRQYQATQARIIEQERQRAAALEAQIREQTLKGMNDYEKAQFAAREAEDRARQLEQTLKQKELEDLKRQDMMRLNKKTGIPLDMLEKATSYDEAQEMAMDYLAQRLEETVDERVSAALEAKMANKTDTGGGKPAPVKTRQEERISAAIESKNSADYVKALFEE